MSNFPWKLLIGPAVLIAVLGIGYPVYWHFAAWRFEQAVAAWSGERRAAGWSVAHGAPAVDGFPMQLRLRLQDPSVAADPAGWRWRGEQVALALQPWNWRRIRIVSAGPQTLEFRLDGTWRRVDAATEHAVFVGELAGDGALSAGMLELAELRAQDGPDRLLVKASSLRLWLRNRDDDGGLSLVLQLREAELADRVRLPLGRSVERLDLDARLRGDLPRSLDAAAVEGWRDRGGAVDVAAFDLRWGPANIRATGRVSLDAMMRPTGALKTELQGYAETVAALEEARLIGRRDAAAARIALELLARPGANGAPAVSLPISAQDGVLYLGPLRLLALPAIPFSARSARRSRPGASR